MHAGAIVAALLVAVAIVLSLVVPQVRGVPGGGEVIVRCRRGHLFTTTWLPWISLKAVRLGTARFQHCPAGNHWSLVTPVRETDLTPEELAQARERHDIPIP